MLNRRYLTRPIRSDSLEKPSLLAEEIAMIEEYLTHRGIFGFLPFVGQVVMTDVVRVLQARENVLREARTPLTLVSSSLDPQTPL